MTHDNYRSGVPAYANFPRLKHPSITILSAAVLSSPGSKGHSKLLSYKCVPSASCLVRNHLKTNIQTWSSIKVLDLQFSNLTWGMTWLQGLRIVKLGQVEYPRWPLLLKIAKLLPYQCVRRVRGASKLENKYSNMVFYKTIGPTALKFDMAPGSRNLKLGQVEYPIWPLLLKIAKITKSSSAPEPLGIFGRILAWNINET